MNLVPILRQCVRLPIRGRTRPPSPPGLKVLHRRSARRVLAWFIAVTLALHILAVVALDVAVPRLRDPEYGLRVERLRARIAENPGRPLVLVIGSSRVSMGLCPAAWERTRPDVPGRPDPLLFNMSLVGSGPIMELMCLRRALADGCRPDVVIVEYWPPFLREDGAFHEPDRIDHNRLFQVDRPLIASYFTKPAEIEHQMLIDRLHPLYQTRHRLLAQINPRWQPWDKRMEMAWANLDGWGWLPGLDEYPAIPAERSKRLNHCSKIYRDQFQGYTIHPSADRAIRETVALARSHGAKVGFAYLPEASEFREWTPDYVDRAGREHLARLAQEFGVPVINARLWMEDAFLVDGFHLSRRGAAEFTQRFAPAVVAAFPDLGGPR